MLDTIELARKIRLHSINMTHQSHASHVASALSIADIIAVLYEEVLVKNPALPSDEGRDRFILSKGHAGIAVYAALAETGFFPVSELDTYYQDGSTLSGHVSHKNVPGVEFSTGSLGHGVCVGAGMAMAAKIDGKTHHIYSIVGDGECDEGSVWEMALFARQQQLSNLTVIIDHNKQQAMGYCRDIIDLHDLTEKWNAFGWSVLEIDGHNHEEIRKSLKDCHPSKPNCIIAHTIKGKGVSFMEDNLLWHYRDPQGEWYERAVEELRARV